MLPQVLVNNMFDEFYSTATDLISQGLPFVTATVVHSEKPTSAKPGDKAIITADKVMHGWIGGSCAQPTVIDESLKALRDGETRLIRLTTDPNEQTFHEGIIDLPMTCYSGGVLEIFIEPQLPLPRLMVIGNLPVAQALARLGKAMNYRVIVVDPETDGVGTPEADEVLTEIDQIKQRITSLTYIVVASHGHYDEVALEQALTSPAAYVALVASRKRSQSVLEYLADQGVAKAELEKLKYPAGLDIHASRGDEIALSIMAEIVQKRRTVESFDIELLVESASEAIDPVCGMTVDPNEAEFAYEFEGHTYYFCCQGCQEAFKAEPEKYLEKPAPAGTAIDPVCGMSVDIATTQYMSEYEGELYYFCAAGCKQAFDNAPESYVNLAEVSNQ